MAANRSIKTLLASPLLAAPLFSALITVMLVSSLAAFAAGGAAVLKDLSGEVYLMPGGQGVWGTASSGMPVAPGDTIRTGPTGRALIVFPDDTSVSLGNDSKLEVTSYILRSRKRTGVLNLYTGKLRAAVKGFAGATDIRVKTPTSVSGVKGTDFMVMNQGRANAVFVETGTVRFSGVDGEGVEVGRGVMTENTGGAEPITPVEVTPGSSLEEVRQRLRAVTDVNAPIEWEEAGRLPEILARWNINYGHYLADSRNYAGALDVLLIAFDLTGSDATRAEARVERGTLYSRNLGEPEKALAEYAIVMDEYPVEPHLENAVYSTGVIYMDLGNRRRAQRFFSRYLKDYPDGAHAGTIRILSRELEKD